MPEGRERAGIEPPRFVIILQFHEDRGERCGVGSYRRIRGTAEPGTDFHGLACEWLTVFVAAACVLEAAEIVIKRSHLVAIFAASGKREFQRSPIKPGSFREAALIFVQNRPVVKNRARFGGGLPVDLRGKGERLLELRVRLWIPAEKPIQVGQLRMDLNVPGNRRLSAVKWNQPQIEPLCPGMIAPLLSRASAQNERRRLPILAVSDA